MPTIPNAWLTCFEPRPQARLRLFCLPYAGANSNIYRPWLQDVPLSIELWSVRLPGRWARLSEPAFTSLAPLVAALAQAIPPYLDKPFAFFGHSMGGLISYELMHTLAQSYHLAPVHLCVSAHRAPHLPDRMPPLHMLSDPQLIGELRRLNGTPEAVLQNADLLSILLPVLRADLAVCETYSYTPRPPLQCPLAVFGGVADAKVTAYELAAWRQHTCHTFHQHMFPGDHFFLHSAQAMVLPTLLQALAAYL